MSEEPQSQEEAFHLAGDRLGKFVILSELGRGAMGVVYEAFQTDLKQKIALKILPANIALDVKQVRRFRREAESIARLRHDNIIRIFEVGEIDNTHYFAMELIEGGVFGEQVGRDKDAIRHAARLVMQAARGLAHAHERGVIHRDIKPGNMLVDRDGRVVVTDFGLARLTDSASLTSTDAIVGTPKYMSPEQILPGTKPMDGRTDVYSLGAALYEVVSGHPPFEEPSVQAFIRAILEARPPNPRKHNRQIPHDLATILLRCLEKDPADRYATAADLADDLERFLGGERIRAKPKGSFALGLETIRRHRLISAFAFIAVVALVLSLSLAGRAAKATQESRIRGRLADITNATDLDVAVQQIEDLAVAHPANGEVAAARKEIHRRWAAHELEKPQPDHAAILRHLEVAGAGKTFWTLMCLIEVGQLDEAEALAAELAGDDPVRAVVSARVALARGDIDAATDRLGPAPVDPEPPEVGIFHDLVSARLHMARALAHAAQGGEPQSRASYDQAQKKLMSARARATTVQARWLKTRINAFLVEVKAGLGDAVNWQEIILDTVAHAREGLNLLTGFWGAMSPPEKEVVDAFTTRILKIADVDQMPRAALERHAEQRVKAAADDVEKVKSNLLLAVARLSLGQADAAERALEQAEEIFHPVLMPYVQWGQSLVYRARNDIPQSLEYADSAIQSALLLKPAFLDFRQLFLHATLLLEEAHRRKEEDPVVRAKASFLEDKLKNGALAAQEWTGELLRRVSVLAVAPARDR